MRQGQKEFGGFYTVTVSVSATVQINLFFSK